MPSYVNRLNAVPVFGAMLEGRSTCSQGGRSRMTSEEVALNFSDESSCSPGSASAPPEDHLRFAYTISQRTSPSMDRLKIRSTVAAS